MSRKVIVDFLCYASPIEICKRSCRPQSVDLTSHRKENREMIEILNCPNQDELSRLNIGKLSVERSELLYDHIETCEQCAEFYTELEEPADDFAKRLAHFTPYDLDKARQAIEEDTLKETATSIWGKVSPMLKSQHQEPSLAVPCQLGQYDVIRLIDKGGMGEVYEAQHVRLKRPVAVKVILGYRQDDPESHRHFLKEMETAGQLDHPNLVRAYDAWEHEGCLFLAQELLIGDSLQDLVNSGNFGGHLEIVGALLGTCRALEQLHEKEFVHRDVKPANIMRLENGLIKLIDYGLAVAADTSRSAIRVGAGTMGYMSPEQAHGGHPIDYRTDIYAAGRVLKYLLSRVNEKMQEVKKDPLAEKLFLLSERMTQQEPCDRPKSASEVIAQLEQLQKELVEPLNATKQAAVPQEAAASSGMQDVKVKNAATLKSKPAPVLEVGPVRKTKPSFTRPGWIVLMAFLVLAAGFSFNEIVFKTDRNATVLVKNHKDGDVIRITSKDGLVREVDLTGDPKFEVGPGTYKIALKEPSNRRINPGDLEITGRDRLTVMIEDNPTDVANDSTKPRMEPESNKTVGNPSKIQRRSEETPAPEVASPKTKELLAARKKQSEQLGLSETLPVGLKGNSSFQEMEFVLIPSGKFLMGAPDSSEDYPAEIYATIKPAHEVIITQPFYISRYEVTQKQFRDVFGAGLTPVDGDGTQYPATQIMWTACVEHCKRLTAQGTNLPEGATVRLPTEAEWEYACRAGTTTRFWWGDTMSPDQASLRLSGRPMQVEPVDSFAPNPFGLYNVHGNLWEWCSDWRGPDYYQTSPSEDPQGPANGTVKVNRGGSWSNYPRHLTSYYRNGYPPDTRSRNVGFRPVIDLGGVMLSSPPYKPE